MLLSPQESVIAGAIAEVTVPNIRSSQVPLVFGCAVCVCTQSLHRVQLFETPWTVAYQAPLSMGFSRQEYWTGLPFLPTRGLLNPGIEPPSLASPLLAGGILYYRTTWEAHFWVVLAGKEQTHTGALV